MRLKFKNFDFLRDCQYSTFDVGRSMFDVQSFRCSGQAEFHKVSVYSITFPWPPAPLAQT